jgi:hypothetical protein
MKLAMYFFLLAGFLKADEASKTAKIDEIFQATKMDRIQTQMMNQLKTIIPSMAAQAGIPPEAQKQTEELSDKIVALVLDKMSWEKMKPTYVKLYAETFSEDEVDGILAFYKSPPGQASLEKLPTLMSKAMTIVQEQMKDIMPEVTKLAKEQAEKAKSN